jgi:hypothetical protein
LLFSGPFAWTVHFHFLATTGQYFMFQILAYFGSPAAAAVLADLPSVNDPNFTQQQNHFIFTEDYVLKAMAAFGAGLTAVQFNDATWNAINPPQIYPPNLSITPPTNPNVVDLRDMPVTIPLNEQIAVQASNNAGGADPEYVLIWISPANGATIPKPQPAPGIGMNGRVRILFTVTTAITAGSWSTDVPIAISQFLKGGTYCILGLNIVAPHCVAWRINFVRAPLYQGRKMLPGGLVENAYGNVPLKYGPGWMGPVGYFDTFEYPQFSLLGSTTEASATYVGYIDALYIGGNMLQNQPLSIG